MKLRKQGQLKAISKHHMQTRTALLSSITTISKKKKLKTKRRRPETQSINKRQFFLQKKRVKFSGNDTHTHRGGEAGRQVHKTSSFFLPPCRWENLALAGPRPQHVRSFPPCPVRPRPNGARLLVSAGSPFPAQHSPGPITGLLPNWAEGQGARDLLGTSCKSQMEFLPTLSLENKLCRLPKRASGG